MSLSITIQAAQDGATVASVLRTLLPDQSWTKVRQLIGSRRVKVGGELCLDPARRLREGQTVELLPVSGPPLHDRELISIRHLDSHVVVVEKPAGLSTVRHPAERDWSTRRKALSSTLDDLASKELRRKEKKRSKKIDPPLRVVHRLDKETSGLVVFARTVLAQRGLGRQFHSHTVIRRYLAVIRGYLPPQRIASFLVRDRGDGLRGNTRIPGQGKEAITHIEVKERLKGYTLLSCRLETGRTHQIRIHLAELGHPICGEKVYNRSLHQPPEPDTSGAPRLALHAYELGFEHPLTGEGMHWTMPLPQDLEKFIQKLRASGKKG
jgi:23S rRNA pseudouridine1911/1915/1917 synthase